MDSAFASIKLIKPLLNKSLNQHSLSTQDNEFIKQNNTTPSQPYLNNIANTHVHIQLESDSCLPKSDCLKVLTTCVPPVKILTPSKVKPSQHTRIVSDNAVSKQYCVMARGNASLCVNVTDVNKHTHTHDKQTTTNTHSHGVDKHTHGVDKHSQTNSGFMTQFKIRPFKRMKEEDRDIHVHRNASDDNNITNTIDSVRVLDKGDYVDVVSDGGLDGYYAVSHVDDDRDMNYKGNSDTNDNNCDVINNDKYLHNNKHGGHNLHYNANYTNTNTHPHSRGRDMANTTSDSAVKPSHTTPTPRQSRVVDTNNNTPNIRHDTIMTSIQNHNNWTASERAFNRVHRIHSRTHGINDTQNTHTHSKRRSTRERAMLPLSEWARVAERVYRQMSECVGKEWGKTRVGAAVRKTRFHRLQEERERERKVRWQQEQTVTCDNSNHGNYSKGNRHMSNRVSESVLHSGVSDERRYCETIGQSNIMERGSVNVNTKTHTGTHTNTENTNHPLKVRTPSRMNSPHAGSLLSVGDYCVSKPVSHAVDGQSHKDNGTVMGHLALPLGYTKRLYSRDGCQQQQQQQPLSSSSPSSSQCESALPRSPFHCLPAPTRGPTVSRRNKHTHTSGVPIYRHTHPTTLSHNNCRDEEWAVRAFKARLRKEGVKRKTTYISGTEVMLLRRKEPTQPPNS